MSNVVKEVFKDFVEENNILNCIIEKADIFKKSDKLEMFVTSNQKIKIEELFRFEQFLKKRFSIGEAIVYIKNSEPIEQNIEEEWDKIVKYVAYKYPITKAIFSQSKISIQDATFEIELKVKGREILEARKVNISLANLINSLYGKKYAIKFIDNVNEEIKKEQEVYLQKLQKEALEKLKQEVRQEKAELAKQKKEEIALKQEELEQEEKTPLILGRNVNIKDGLVKIADITIDSGKISLEGELLSIDSRELKSGKFLVMFNVYDGTSTITCKSFVEPEKVAIVLDRLKQAKGIRAAGTAQFDPFAKEIGVICNVIVETAGVKKEKRMDNSTEKRVELHLHTQMSQMDAVTPATDLLKRAVSWGMKSIAITDHGVVQSFPDAHKFLQKTNADIKVIYGVEAYLVPDENAEELLKNEKYKGELKRLPSYHAIVLAKNYVGLKNLYKLISYSHLDYFYKKPRLLKSLYKKYSEGLILGSACEAGELYRAIVAGKSEEEIEQIANDYDYLEIQPIGNNMYMVREGILPNEEAVRNINRKIVELGEKLGKLVVATCDVHFIDPQDEIYRRILQAGQGYEDADYQAPLYFRTTEEMLDEFAYLGKEKAYEVVVTNTNKVSDMCEKISPISPEKCPPHIDGCEQTIKDIAYGRAIELYGDPLPEIVKARLDKELESIIKNGFSVMYIIAQKLVWKSNEDGYLVGSRGSVGSSFVANMTGITEVNSLQPHYRCSNCKYSDFTDYGVKNGFDLPDKECPKCGHKLDKDGMDIPFETFLGFDGDKEPDIDLNFSGEYQAKAHRYTEVIFGKGTTFKAGTIGTIADKTAFGYVKKYYEDRHIPVNNAEVVRIATGCTGVKRTTGQHPGGIIVVPKGREIFEFCPVQHPADDPNSDIITTHFDYHSIDQNLLKLDILGHDDPTMIRMLQDITGIDPQKIPLDDKETMSIFSSTKALGVTPEQINSEVGSFGVPEFGTKFVRGMLVDTKPTTFEELLRISGLSHGTDVWLNNAQTLIENGTIKLEDAICTRDDIMIYLIKKGLPPKPSFKIMESVRKGKGLTEEQEALMRENDVPDWYIDSCKKIKYMFPKAHAAAYVTMAFRIAWFKVHIPKAYYTAYYSIRADDFDSEFMIYGKEKVKNKMRELEMQGNAISTKDKNVYAILEIVLEMYERGINFLPIDLYKSHATKFIMEEDGIRPPLNSIPGLGSVAAQSIDCAKQAGKFMCIDDLQIKAKIGKSVTELLKKFGCLEGMTQSNQLSLFNF